MSDEANRNYAKQHRGDAAAYEKYFAGMDASMQQKIALTTAHFPTLGTIADMGSGSGRGTFDLAQLYQNLILIGVDINAVAVEQSAAKYQAANLRFQVGDIADKVFADNSLDGILNSSVLHHVTSFNDYDIAQINRTLANQVAELKFGGALIIRDFVVPDKGESEIFLDLPNDDGSPSGNIPDLSSAALFEIFARDFRSSRNRNFPVPYRRHSGPQINFTRFSTLLRFAAEFVLRKNYRADWDAELIEEYTYFTQSEFEQAFRAINLRTTISLPLWNPWIVENRFVDKFYLSDKNGESVSFPPTNFLIVGEKIAPAEGYEIIEAAGGETIAPRFLKLKYYRHRFTEQVFELVTRPHQTIDVLPWFQRGEQIFVLAKKDFPRPLLNACRSDRNLHSANYSGYLTEPISAIADAHACLANAEDEIVRILQTRANLSRADVLQTSEKQFYYTSPGGVDERVQSYLVKIAALDREPQQIENYTPFACAGTVREMDALQVLRASHVGGMFDARLEINIYRLLRQLNKSAGAWIGTIIKPQRQNIAADFAAFSTFDEYHRQTPNHSAVFDLLAADDETTAAPQFLELRRSEFVENNAHGAKLAAAEFEFVVPRRFSKNTAAAIPFFQTAEHIFVGIEMRDLPAPQNFTGNSALACVPAWRLPFSLKDNFSLAALLGELFERDFGIQALKCWQLGGAYFPTPGITPEIVYPFAVEITVGSATPRGLQFIKLNDLIARLDEFQDAHLLITANRLFHALAGNRGGAI